MRNQLCLIINLFGILILPKCEGIECSGHLDRNVREAAQESDNHEKSLPLYNSISNCLSNALLWKALVCHNASPCAQGQLQEHREYQCWPPMILVLLNVAFKVEFEALLKCREDWSLDHVILFQVEYQASKSCDDAIEAQSGMSWI